MNLDQEFSNKLQDLLFSVELAAVKQGLLLWESLIDNINQDAFVQQMLLLSQYSESLDDEELADLSDLDLIWSRTYHSTYIALWNLGMLAQFPNLETREIKELNVEHSLLSELPEAIAQLQQLGSVDIGSNNLTEFPLFLQELPIKTLNLTHNQITSPDPDISLPLLQSVNISANNLKGVPSFLLRSPHLLELYLTNNNLSALDETVLSSIPELNTLDLSQNNLRTLPKSFSKLNKLNTLDLSHNEFSSLPSCLNQLADLTSLDLSYNLLREIEFPPHFSSLKMLYLGGNHLSSLPSSIQNLSNLEKLFVRRNKLRSIPTSLDKLKNLHTIDLGQNRIGNLSLREIDSIFWNITTIPKLQELILSQNSLSTLSKDVFTEVFLIISKNSDLERLNLYGNQLKPEQINRIEDLFPHTEITL